ncbi:hypothetical protein FACS189487_03430 [Campylobacterota bacterium]|nr:hypothetical protein FACS189487_03430 [Campylobacterota bacterium]
MFHPSLIGSAAFAPRERERERERERKKRLTPHSLSNTAKVALPKS